jgi:hypothetical protein
LGASAAWSVLDRCTEYALPWAWCCPSSGCALAALIEPFVERSPTSVRWQRANVLVLQRSSEPAMAPAPYDAGRADRVAAAGGPGRSSTAGAVDTDETRWQRVISDEPAVLTYQRIDGEPVGVPVSFQRVDFNSFTLRNRGFDWVKDYPYLK